jgi:hypothetical protein
MIAWGRMITSFFTGFNNDAETGLMRLFRIEYAEEYRHMKRMGYEINDINVKAFLETRKQS